MSGLETLRKQLQTEKISESTTFFSLSEKTSQKNLTKVHCLKFFEKIIFSKKKQILTPD